MTPSHVVPKPPMLMLPHLHGVGPLLQQRVDDGPHLLGHGVVQLRQGRLRDEEKVDQADRRSTKKKSTSLLELTLKPRRCSCSDSVVTPHGVVLRDRRVRVSEVQLSTV